MWRGQRGQSLLSRGQRRWEYGTWGVIVSMFHWERFGGEDDHSLHPKRLYHDSNTWPPYHMTNNLIFTHSYSDINVLHQTSNKVFRLMCHPICQLAESSKGTNVWAKKPYICTTAKILFYSLSIFFINICHMYQSICAITISTFLSHLPYIFHQPKVQTTQKVTIFSTWLIINRVHLHFSSLSLITPNLTNPTVQISF